MTDLRKSGLALIIGSIGGIVTMAIHPTASTGLDAAQVQHLAMHSAIAHSLAMVSNIVMVLGACGLTQRLRAPDRLAFSALVFYLFGAVAILIATAVSGFIVPDIMVRMFQDTAAAAPQWHIAIVSIFAINQAFAKIYSVAVSVAMVLWSLSALRHGGLGRVIGLYGCIAAPALVVGVCIGMVRLNVLGMAIVVLVQAAWFIGAGVQLNAEGLKAEAASVV
jgi:hypothetical protein